MSLESMPTVGGLDVLPNPIPEADPEPPKPDPTPEPSPIPPVPEPAPAFFGSRRLRAAFWFCNRPSQKQWRQSDKTRLAGSRASQVVQIIVL
jgi:hypothetical protein